VIKHIYKFYGKRIFKRIAELGNIESSIKKSLDHSYKNGTYYSFRDKIWLLKELIVRGDFKNFFAFMKIKNRENTFRLKIWGK
jgi:hypothetical protein